MKMPIHVWKIIKRIQREFLWGDRGGRKKITWVKWDVVCKPKHCGGLGVRDIRAVNISLLAKWRWRLLLDDTSLWKAVIKGKYGDLVIGRLEVAEECKPWFSSSWWKDVCLIGTNLDHNWFSQGVVKKMGNGEHTRFWEDVWLGNSTLRDRFPRLFSILIQQQATVASLRPSNGEEGWNLLWRRRLFVWESNLLIEMMKLINHISLTGEVDRWTWIGGDTDLFTVKDAYAKVSNLLLPRGN
jgi:hypothetical protein